MRCIATRLRNRSAAHASRTGVGAVCLLLLLACGPATADVYRCTSAAGEISYRDSPCPGGAQSANITEAVQACTTPECEAQRERARAGAEERLRAERAALGEMQEQRLRAEEKDLERRLMLEQLDRMQALEAQLAAQRAAESSAYYPAYPWYGGIGYPGQVRPPGRPCAGPGCDLRPDLPRPPRPQEPAVSRINPGPASQRSK
jgi:hypothetical protein